MNVNKINRILFVGMYPNEADQYLNAFFQNLIFAMADNGIECTVISPVSITKYGKKIAMIPKEKWDITPNEKRVKVFFPRYISASAKKIGSFNTRIITEYNFQKCAVKAAVKLKERYDAVYGHFILDGGLAAVKVGKKLKIPSFFAYGECDYESQVKAYYRELTAKDLIGLKGVISVSSKNTNELRQLAVFEKIPIFTSPNAANSTIFFKKDKRECRKKMGLDEDKFIVGFVGGFINRKGDKRLLCAINQLENIYVAFAGKGDDPPSGERVLFCKSLPHEDIADFLNAVDVFALPTLSEGSCNAIAEAMACGLPVVSSDLPFNYDLLNNNNAILINPNSVDELKCAINELYVNSEYRTSLENASLEVAKELEIHVRAKSIVAFMSNNI